MISKQLLLLFSLFCANANAANKWIDEQGKVHYSDQTPPAHVKTKSSLNFTMPAAPATTGVATKNAADPDATKQLPTAKKAAADKAAIDAANKEIKQSNCAAAKQNLANLKDGMRIAIIDPTTGERSYLDDAQRAKSIDDAQQQISKNCQ